jgi:hypothetical protein
MRGFSGDDTLFCIHIVSQAGDSDDLIESIESAGYFLRNLDSSSAEVPFLPTGWSQAVRKIRSTAELRCSTYFIRVCRIIDPCLCHKHAVVCMVVKNDPEYNNPTLLSNTSVFIIVGDVGIEVHFCKAGVFGESR